MNSVCVSVIGDVAVPYEESIVSMRDFIARPPARQSITRFAQSCEARQGDDL